MCHTHTCNTYTYMQHIHQHIHLFKEVTVNATHTFRLFKEEEETYSLIEALQFSSVTVMS